MKPLSADSLLQPLCQPNPSPSGDPDVQVALADYNGWWAPLTHLFYSNTSRCLVSVHPESSIETVESYYCPHCLTTFAEAEASIAANRCPKCFECPECQCILGIAQLPPSSGDGGGGGEEQPGFHFECGYCHWSSQSVGLVEENPDFLGMAVSVAERDSPQEEMFHRLVNKLRWKAVKAMEEAGDQSAKILAQTLTHSVSQPATPEPSSPQRPDASSPGVRSSPSKRRPWRLSDLQQKEQDKAERQRELQDLKRGAALYPTGWRAGELAADHDQVTDDFLAMSTLKGVSRADQRLAHCLHQPQLSSELRPLRTPLFTKRSRRCRKDVDEGRPGILLKPKVNPLEGDSSMRSNVGRWWNKDSSAMHVLPRVSVLTLPELGRLQQLLPDPSAAAAGLSVVLKLVNPVHGRVTVTLVPQEVAEAQEAAGRAAAITEAVRRASLDASASPATGSDRRPQPPPVVEGEDGTTLYFRRRLQQALGDEHAVLLQADLPPSYEEEATVVLEGYEDEYLDDEEGGGGHMDFSAEQAISQGGLSPKDKPGASRVVVFRSKYTAWYQVPLVLEDVAKFEQLPQAPRTFGVLLFFRLTSTAREYTPYDPATTSDLLSATLTPSTTDIIVPVLVAVRLPPPGFTPTAAAGLGSSPGPSPRTPVSGGSTSSSSASVSSPPVRRVSSPLVQIFSSPSRWRKGDQTDT